MRRSDEIFVLKNVLATVLKRVKAGHATNTIQNYSIILDTLLISRPEGTYVCATLLQNRFATQK
jgi:hypothetical protein